MRLSILSSSRRHRERLGARRSSAVVRSLDCDAALAMTTKTLNDILTFDAVLITDTFCV